MKALAGFGCLMFTSLALAHQPVMDMAPRWSDGFGIQIRHQRFGSDSLLQGKHNIENPQGFERYVKTTWVEGVYTFDRTIRATIKIPIIDQQRVTSINTLMTSQQNTGLGDIIVALPLKRYTNQGASTQNWGFTPSVRMPTGTSSGAFPNSDGSWDVGLSLSYSSETPGFYQLYDLYYWNQGSGDRGMQSGDSWGLDINVGLHPWHDNDTNAGIFTMWDVSAYHEEMPNALNLTTASGTDRVQTGPVLVYYRHSLMLRAEFKFLAYEHVDGISASRGNEISLGIGYAF